MRGLVPFLALHHTSCGSDKPVLEVGGRPPDGPSSYAKIGEGPGPGLAAALGAAVGAGAKVDRWALDGGLLEDVEGGRADGDHRGTCALHDR